jgi:hypothetical protein
MCGESRLSRKKKPDPRFAAVEASCLVFDIVNGF